MSELKKATFKHIEAELLDLGNGTKRVLKEMSEWKTHPENLRYNMLSYHRRCDWLERLIDAVDILYNKVNKETKDIIDLRYFKNLSPERIIKENDISAQHLQKFHKLFVNAVIEKLGFGETDEQAELSRYVPTETKREVLDRDGKACVKCGETKNLHFHHIMHYADGGTHEPYNLMVLCASCHAEEHEGEKSYYLLKKVSEG